MRLLRSLELSFFEFEGELDSPYWIQSHVWYKNGQEVTYEEMKSGTGKVKYGYDKIVQCGKFAAEKGYKYFWIDTCCTIQAHHRRQCPTKRVAYAAKNGGRMYIAFQYRCITISILIQLKSGTPHVVTEQPLSQHEPA